MSAPDQMTNGLLAALRRALRAGGWTHARLMEHFECSASTIKRWLSGRGLTLETLAALAHLAEISLADLVRDANVPPPHVSNELTLAQEQALSEDGFLSFIFILLLGGERWQDVEADLGVSAVLVENALERLDRLALIDRLPGGRVRPLVNRAIIWRKTPMRRQYELAMKQQFIDMDFSAPDAVYAADTIKLSQAGAAQLAEIMERYRHEIQQLQEQDRAHSRLARTWYATLTAMRPLDLSGLPNDGSKVS